METMRVAVYHNNRDVRIEERPIPQVGDDELLVKVHASGVCGSDVLEWYRVPKAPVVLGHEIAAEVVKVGSQVRGWDVGERVFVSHHVPCGECAYCRTGHETVCHTLRTTNFDPGGFAEYVRVPSVNVRKGMYRLPDSLTDEEAVFVEPLACAVRGQRLADLQAGRNVLVLGTGMAGLLHLRLAKVSGAGGLFATDVVEARRAAAERSGTKAVWDGKEDVPAKLRKANRDLLADLVIVCTGAPAAIDQAFSCVEPGGTILFFAPTQPDARIMMPFNRLWRDEVTITSSYGAGPRDIRESIDLLGGGHIAVKDLITDQLPLAEAAKAFRLVAEGTASIKVLLRPGV